VVPDDDHQKNKMEVREMARLQVTIVESGSGNSYNVGSANTFEKASSLIDELEARFERWSENDFPPLHEQDPLGHFEGCDVYAIDRDGVQYFLNGDTWELWNAKEAIEKVNRIFRFASTNPSDDMELDAELLDEVIDLWERILFLHWPLRKTVRLTNEQKRNLIHAWRFQ
jgi:hypothetical protein